MVAAGGNWRQDLDAAPVYPAAYPGVLSVAVELAAEPERIPAFVIRGFRAVNVTTIR